MCAHVWERVLALGGAPCVCVERGDRALECRFGVLGAPGNVVIVCVVFSVGVVVLWCVVKWGLRTRGT